MGEYRKYELWRCIETRRYKGEGPVEIGRIIDLDNSGDVAAYIVYEKFGKTDSPYHMYTDIRNKGAVQVFTIMVDDHYRRLFNTKVKSFEAMALHELGHYICGHLDKGFLDKFFPEVNQEKTKINVTDNICKARCMFIEHGAVLPLELEADAFACEEVGPRIMNEALDLMIKERQKRNDPAAELAIKEFRLRKKAISRRMITQNIKIGYK